jgi:hypothetical protein
LIYPSNYIPYLQSIISYFIKYCCSWYFI